MDNIKLTQIEYWDITEIYLLDNQDRGYIARNIESFETDLEESGAFRDVLRGLLHSLGGEFSELAKEPNGDRQGLIDAVNRMFEMEPDKFEEHFKRI